MNTLNNTKATNKSQPELTYLYARSTRITSNFSYINWLDLIARIENPPAIPVSSDSEIDSGLIAKQVKVKSDVITAHNAKDKTKQTALNHNNFTLLRADLDDSELNVCEIQKLLNENGVKSYAIHSTASHKPDNQRYRLYIELADSLIYEQWSALETYLSYILGADDCASRPHQVMYLPFLFNNYEYFISSGQAFDAAGSNLLYLATKYQTKQVEAIQYAATKQQKAVKPTFVEKLVGKQISIINLINKGWTWEQLLPLYGYKQQGLAWLPPESTSNRAGVYILTSQTDGKQRYYSHHENDPCATGRSLDIFDFLVIREYNGDYKNALADIAQNHFKEAHSHNRREFKISKHNQSMMNNFGGLV